MSIIIDTRETLARKLRGWQFSVFLCGVAGCCLNASQCQSIIEPRLFLLNAKHSLNANNLNKGWETMMIRLVYAHKDVSIMRKKNKQTKNTQKTRFPIWDKHFLLKRQHRTCNLRSRSVCCCREIMQSNFRWPLTHCSCPVPSAHCTAAATAASYPWEMSFR